MTPARSLDIRDGVLIPVMEMLTLEREAISINWRQDEVSESTYQRVP